ncbi:MAG: MIP/aquaporin family protein [Anaerolineae bacterium]
MNDDFKPSIAELIGTFILVFIGAGAGALGSGGIVGVALAHGIAVTVIVYTVGAVSGAHVNPAVTFGVAVAGKIEWRRAVWYWIAQVIGAVLAALVLLFVLGGQSGNLGATTLGSGTSPIQGVVIEAVLTVFLMMSVLVSGVLGKNGNLAGVAIGFVLIMDILMGGSLTGASMNPARTLGPAIVMGNFADLWVYLVGPLAGGAIAAGLIRYLYRGE